MKKTKTLLLAAFAVITGLALTSCMKDAGSPPVRSHLALATVDNPDESIFYFFTLDNGTVMWTAATNVFRFRPATGQRILANYTILSTLPAGSSHDHNVRLNSVYSVLTKEIIEITDENDAEIGNDPYRSVRMWVSGDWLNVEFVFMGFNGTHLISVGEDLRTGAETPTDGALHLQLRRNGHGDAPARSLWGLASFSLLPYRVDGQTEVPLSVHANISGMTDGRTFDLVYRYGVLENPVIEVNMFQEQADVE